MFEMMPTRQPVLRLALSFACIAVVAMAVMASATAQGPVYRERWGYLHLENRRAELFEELRARSSEDVKKVSELLSEPDQGVPFRPVAKALAFLRGVEADDAFQLRAALGTYVLPEVVDPESSMETCRAANFSVFLPFAMKIPGALTFAVVVRDAAQKQVFQATIERNCALEDLRMARATISVGAADLPDGSYEVALSTLLDGKQPRQHDPELRWTFHILRGYQRRADAAIASLIAIRDELSTLHRALLDGLAAQVSRAYTGEAFAVSSNAVQELERLEVALKNLAELRPPLAGMRGKVTTAVPAGEVPATGTAAQHGDANQQIVQPCVLRMPVDEQPHPMVVFATGAPAFDLGSRRPIAPAMREANWLLQEIAGFGVTEQWHVVCCDSPGGGRPYRDALLAALQALPQVLPTGGQLPLLVCDREAASIVGMQLTMFQPYISGVVLVGGGAMPPNVIAKLGDFPVRYVSLHGYPGAIAIERTLQFLAAKPPEQQDANGTLDVAMLHERPEPWLFGVSRSLPELRRFATQVFARD